MLLDIHIIQNSDKISTVCMTLNSKFLTESTDEKKL